MFSTARSIPLMGKAGIALAARAFFFLLPFGLFLVGNGLYRSEVRGEERPPNVVFLFADDLGWTDLGSFGSSFYETPNLDRLASQGVKLTNAYAACPVCSPTRASLLTGLWPQRTGITDYIGAAQPAAWKRNTQLLPAPYTPQLEHSFESMAEVVKRSGYKTFFAGKWHLGPEGHYPEDQGFDINRGGIALGGPYGGKKYFSPYDNPRLSDGPEGEHLPDRLASEAARFIEENRDHPFLVYFPFYSVHTPLMARPDLQAKYEKKGRDLGLSEVWGQEGQRKVRHIQSHAIYAAMVEAMDQAVGKVLGKLDAMGLANNTLVVFTSDNGGLSTSEGHPTSNLPLRGGKGWLYEGGVRVSTLARWPDRWKGGTESSYPISSPDWMPTIAEATRSQAPSGLRWDGISLLPVLDGVQKGPERELYWHYPHYGNQGGKPGGAIRQGNWKLIEWYDRSPVELYNLQIDLGESNNLASANPKLVEELTRKLATWRQDVGAKMPTPNPMFDPMKKEDR